MTVPTAAVRLETYNRFARHNRHIAALRWIVPALGLVALSVPVVQLFGSMAADMLPVEGVRLENDTLVIEGPRFAGRTAAGSNYVMDAQSAESRVGDLDTADLYGLTVDITGGGDYAARVEFDEAVWTMSTQHLVSNETVTVADSTGAQGTLAGVEVDWPNQMIESDGPVRFTFGSGAQLVADTMVYDMDAARWRFSRVDLDMVPQADAGEPRDPFAPESST